MSLTVGELTGYIRADDGQFVRTLDEDRLRMAGLQRDVNGRLRDMRGRFVTDGEAMGDALRRAGDRGNGLTISLGGISGASGSLGDVAGSAGMMALKLAGAIPAASTLASALIQIAPAAAVGATAVFALAQAVAVVKIGTSGIGDALKAAFAPGTASAGAAASAARQHADALRGVKDATEQAAVANQGAARSTAQAERSLTDAQKQAVQAQKDLNAAREQATRDLQDMNNQLADAQLSQRQDVLDLASAQQQLNADRAAGAGVSADQAAQDQLAYDQAAQRLKEQQIDTQRLTEDTAKANKAGMDGSQTMVNAQQKVVDADQAVIDAVQALKDTQQAQARTAQQGVENIAKAQEAVAASSAGAAGGVDQFAQAMANLSPNARAFVQQLIALKGQWDALKSAVQNRLFAGLAGDVKTLASSALPVLRTNLVSTAGALNGMARSAISAAREVASNGTLGRAMASASLGLHNLSGAPGTVITALGQLAAAAGPTFDRFTAAIGKGITALGTKLSDAFSSGQLQTAIQTAASLIGELVTTGANIASIIGSVFKATAANGGGLIGTLKVISGELAKAFASPAVQSGLRALSATTATLAATAAPLLGKALAVIAPVLTALGPPAQALIRALGAGLTPIVTALGPVLVSAAHAVGAIVTAFLPLLPLVGKLIAQLLPALTPLLDAVTVVFQQLAPVVSVLAGALGAALTPVLSALPQIVQPFALLLGMLATTILPVVAQLVVALSPVLTQLGTAFGQILVALAPLLTILAQLISRDLQGLMILLTPVIGLVGKLATVFAALGTQYISGVLIPALHAVTDLLSGHFSKAWADVKEAIRGWAAYLGTLFVQLPERLAKALAPLAIKLYLQAQAAGAQLLIGLAGEGLRAVAWVAGLPGMILHAIGDLGSLLWYEGQNIVIGLWNGIVSMSAWLARTLVGWAEDVIPGPIAHALGINSPSTVMRDRIGRWIPAGVVEGIKTGAPAVSRAMAALAGIPAASGSLATLSAPAVSTGRGLTTTSTGSTVTHRVVIDVTGGESAFKAFVRNMVRVDGRGSVQTAFG